MVRYHWPASGSRASVERMVRSGSEPTYLPLTNTSFAGLLLYFLGAANALDAVAIAIAIASAVLVNMVVSPAGWSIHLVRCVAAFRARKMVAVNHLEVPRPNTTKAASTATWKTSCRQNQRVTGTQSRR